MIPRPPGGYRLSEAGTAPPASHRTVPQAAKPPGWAPQPWKQRSEPAGGAEQVPAITGALLDYREHPVDPRPAPFVACYWTSGAGGTIAKPIFSFPGGRRFHFCDPAGNELAVWSDT
jgi:hypothetical protein